MYVVVIILIFFIPVVPNLKLFNKIKLKFVSFYSTALKGCRGIVFTHGVRMDGRAVRKVCLACISGTARCRKLILGRDIG